MLNIREILENSSWSIQTKMLPKSIFCFAILSRRKLWDGSPMVFWKVNFIAPLKNWYLLDTPTSFLGGCHIKLPIVKHTHKKGGRSDLAQLMKFLWISPKTRQLGETFEGWLWFTKPNLPTAPVDQNIWSGFWEWSRQKFTVEPRKYNFSY